ncbi:zinc ABC transporter substrate-binding protein [Marinobacterium lutimaris]|nr:zinc ABC transporter substrate-binding protein [Marinobacterium lutimaris]
MSTAPAMADDGGVVASIKPLGMIAAALTEGVTETRVLLPDGASPHHYAMKPSDMRSLDDARLVVWVGPELERFLEKPLNQAGVAQVALISGEAEGQAGHEHHAEDEDHDEQGQDHEADEHADHHDEHASHADEHEESHHDEHEHDGHEEAAHDHGHEHDHGGLDVHPWLDPMTGLEAARNILARLIEVYPEQEAQLVSNFERFEASVNAVDRQIWDKLEPLHERGFFVFHDAYTGFVKHYNLNQLGYFTVDPGRSPGARHLAEIRETLEQKQAACVLTEPQFSSALVERITDGLELKTAEIDPLAVDSKLSATAYADYLLDLAGRFEKCLEP